MRRSDSIESVRVLLEGPMVPGSTTVSRNLALAGFVPQTRIFDSTRACVHESRFWNILGHRLYCTPANVRFNLAFWREVNEFRPDIVWVDKGRWLWPWTLSRIRRIGAAVVHYNTDDLFAWGSYLWLHRLGLEVSDLYVTTNRFNATEIPKRYGLACFRAGMGHHKLSHQPDRAESIVSKEYQGDVVFVGHWEPHTEDRVARLRESGLDVRVWGYNWKRARRPAFRAVRPLPAGDYVRTLRAAKLALCSLSRMNRNESTGRSFEIPAIGACLFAERTAEHSFLYRDGIEAIFFENNDEMLEKALRYCNDLALRNRVAEAGYQRCKVLELSWQKHMEREWPIVMRWFQERRLCLLPSDDAPFWPGFRNGHPSPTAR